MLRFFSILLFVMITITSQAQKTGVAVKDSKTLNFLDRSPQLKKSRIFSVAGIWAASYGSSLYILSNYWYDDLKGFRTYNDAQNWLQVDKMGHAHTAYFQGVWGAQLMKWSGLKHTPSTLIGGSIGFANQAIIEILDGKSQNYGWSNYDFLSNAAGSAFFIGQELLWKEQRIYLKFGYNVQDYSKYNYPLLEEVALQEFGKGAESFFKDYNAQTYWLSANIYSFLPETTKFPKWLNVAVGMGGDLMFHAVENTSRSIENVQRRREYYLSLDADFTKIKAQTSVGKTLLFLLNIFKMPSPALKLNSNGELRFIPLSF